MERLPECDNCWSTALKTIPTEVWDAERTVWRIVIGKALREKGYHEGLDAAYKAAQDCTVAIREPGIYLLNRDLVLEAIDSLRNGGVDDSEMGA